MLSLLKADLYRLFKTKSYYIVGIILGLIGVFLSYLVGSFEGSDAVTNIELTELLYQIFMNSIVVMIIGIEASTFICLDFSSGYIKNIASSVKRKSIITISKFITLMIGILLYFIFMVLTTYVSGRIFIGTIAISNVSGLVKYLGMVYFLTIVIVGFVVLATSLFRSNTGSIVSLVLVIFLAALGYMAINRFFGIDLSSISPINNYGLLTPYNTDTWVKMILSGLGFLGVYIVGSSVLMEVKDIV